MAKQPPLSMDLDAVTTLRATHPAWRLLLADHAPLVLSFLHREFLEPNRRNIAQDVLAAALDGHLTDARASAGEQAYPRTAQQYLDDWASDEKSWLRKYYPPGVDVPHFDLQPSTEKVLAWLVSLRQRQFVGTESRLNTVLELLRQMTTGTEQDPAKRLETLEAQRARLDIEITEAKAGRIAVMDATQVRDRFLQMESTARALLSDFREVEQNFRVLDRGMRERIATADGAKGSLLERVLGERDAIDESDQGRSFRAFWTFLMSPTTQDELAQMLETVLALPAVREMQPDPRLARIHEDWHVAGEATQATVRKLSAQLRRFLDDEARLESRRIIALVRELEQRALAVRNTPPEDPFMELDEPSPRLGLIMERPLFSPAFKARLTGRVVVDGVPDVTDETLFEQVYVDRARLLTLLQRALRSSPQVSLEALVEEHPLEQGLAELVTWLSIAAEDRHALIDDGHRSLISWIDADGPRRATLPRVVFVRGGETP